MAQFIRQLNIISSLKPGSDGDKMVSVYKVIGPVLTFNPSVRLMHTQNLYRNIMLKTHEIGAENQKAKRNLAIILPWMNAKSRHVDKYVNVYMSKGFDVMTVNISLKQMMFPVTGTQVVVKNILDYVEKNEHYDKVLFHAFSIGAYLMGEVFTELKESEERYTTFSKRVVGMIFDSAIGMEGMTTAFPRAFTNNPLIFKALRWYIQTHMACMYNVATKHYIRSSQNFHNTPIKCPALMLVSKSDKFGTPEANQHVANCWKAKGLDVSLKCWEKSEHVGHMRRYEDEYITEIDKFLMKLNLNPS